MKPMFCQQRNAGHRKSFAPRSPTGSCSLSLRLLIISSLLRPPNHVLVDISSPYSQGCVIVLWVPHNSHYRALHLAVTLYIFFTVYVCMYVNFMYSDIRRS